MSHFDSAPPADYPAAVESLTRHVLDSLRGMTGVSGLAAHVAQAADLKSALAAVRVLGPDVFAPAVLVSASFDADDREVVAEALRVFPPAPEDAPETACLGWATATLLTRFGGETVAVPDMAQCVPVDGADGAPAAPDAADTAADAAGDPAGEARWRAWSLAMARLAPLALPGMPGAANEQARGRTLALNRGVVRSMLRRDYPTAARLARWAALARHRDLPQALDVTRVVTHLELCGADGTRTLLNTAIARLFLTARQERENRTP